MNIYIYVYILLVYIYTYINVVKFGFRQEVISLQMERTS